VPSETSHEEKTEVGIEVKGRRGRRLKGLSIFLHQSARNNFWTCSELSASPILRFIWEYL